MSETTDRLERLITAERGGCCEDDLAARLESLRSLQESLPANPDADLAALTALGNDTRYTIVWLLAAAQRELCVCEINPVVDVSDSAISHALSDLTEAGLVTRRKDGRWRKYRASNGAVALLTLLDGVVTDE